MIIELRNINRSPKIKDAFLAFLYIDGEKAGLVWNRGNGRLTFYHHVDERGRFHIVAAELEQKMKEAGKNLAEWTQPLAPLLDELARNSGKKIKRTRGKRP